MLYLTVKNNGPSGQARLNGSFENEALENEDRSTKHPNLENEAPKTRKRRPLNLENEAPKSRKGSS